MYVPEALSNLTNGSGSVLIGGIALISAIVAGIALGWIGTIGVVTTIFLLLVAEVVREAAGARRKLDELESDLASVRREAAVIPGLRAERQELRAAVAALEEENRRPRLRPEEILDVIGTHIRLIDVAQKHRQMAPQVPDIHVIRAELTEDGVLLTGTCVAGGDIVSGELMAVVESQTGIAWGSSAETFADGTLVQVGYQLEDLPPDLAEEVEQRGSLNPPGYALHLSGLYVPNYDSLEDDELQKVKDALLHASEALANTLSRRTMELSIGDDLVEDNQTISEEEEEGHP